MTRCGEIYGPCFAQGSSIRIDLPVSGTPLATNESALEIAQEAIVLLKNDGEFLPLDASKLKRLVVVGDNAITRHAPGRSQLRSEGTLRGHAARGTSP